MNTDMTEPNPAADAGQDAALRKLATAVQQRAPLDAATMLERESDETIAEILNRLQPSFALRVMLRLPEHRRELVLPRVRDAVGDQSYDENSLGRLMEPAAAVFGMGVTVRQAIEKIRELVKEALFTYAYVIDDEGRLRGVVVMRDLLYANPNDLLIHIMVENPFYFEPETSITEAMKAVVHRHYPAYPVCDRNGKLLGVVQGYMLFEEQAFEISAQPGRMVGVQKEERLATPWPLSLRFRHPWLQLNLVTAFLAAAVVGTFEDTIAQVVVLAAFLPVLAGQSGNTGCQALAVTLRGLTLGEFTNGMQRKVVMKEALLGLMNGLLVGVVAAAAMYFYASHSQSAEALKLALVVLLAMIGACVASGVTGVLVPLTLKRLGADPATASSIFLTTATDVTSMGLFLSLAKLFVL
ncbi:MAG: Magnesium transporter MgtE [Gammaproteobacteria bacterium]|nr:Magnesium transporter MgtE [Gammaproteobacteria bacterium]